MKHSTEKRGTPDRPLYKVINTDTYGVPYVGRNYFEAEKTEELLRSQGYRTNLVIDYGETDKTNMEERNIKTDAQWETVATDRQVGGSHYQLAIQPIDYIMDNGLDYMQGNVIKYVTRYKNKNGIDDLRKAAHYIEMMIEREQGLRNWFNEEAGTSDTNI